MTEPDVSASYLDPLRNDATLHGPSQVTVDGRRPATLPRRVSPRWCMAATSFGGIASDRAIGFVIVQFVVVAISSAARWALHIRWHPDWGQSNLVEAAVQADRVSIG